MLVRVLSLSVIGLTGAAIVLGCQTKPPSPVADLPPVSPSGGAEHSEPSESAAGADSSTNGMQRLQLDWPSAGLHPPFGLRWSELGIDAAKGPRALRWDPDTARAVERLDVGPYMPEVEYLVMAGTTRVILTGFDASGNKSSLDRSFGVNNHLRVSGTSAGACLESRCVFVIWRDFRDHPPAGWKRIVITDEGRETARYEDPSPAHAPLHRVLLVGKTAILASTQQVWLVSDDAEELAPLLSGDEVFWDIAAGPDGETLLVSRHEALETYSLATDGLVATLPLPVRDGPKDTRVAKYLAVSDALVAIGVAPFVTSRHVPPDGRVWVHLVDVSSQSVCGLSSAPPPRALAFSPDGARLAVLSEDEVVALPLDAAGCSGVSATAR